MSRPLKAPPGLVHAGPTETTPLAAKRITGRADNNYMTYGYWRRHLALFAAFMLTVSGFTYLGATPAHAATITVNFTGDLADLTPGGSA